MKAQWFGIALGVLAIGFGLKCFTPGGLPFARSKALRGGPAMAIGAVSLMLGVALLGTSIFFWNRS